MKRFLAPIGDLATTARQAGADLVEKAGAGLAAASAMFEAPSGDALDFEEVLVKEMAVIDRLRKRRRVRARDHRPEDDPSRPPTSRAHRRQLVGLAFSGGGIRSATFNLGILQALAQLDLLRHFDYLSTVSGGGYIGSWLTAWIKRRGIEATQAGLKVEQGDPGRAADGDAGAVLSPITFLRSYSNYLTPQKGLFSLDTWMAAASYVRNLILNLNVLVFALAFVILLPRLFVSLVFFAQQLDRRWWNGPWLLPASIAVLSVICAHALSVRLSGSTPSEAAWLSSPKGVFRRVVLPICGLTLLFVFWLFGEPRAEGYRPWVVRGGAGYLGFWLLVAGFWFVVWLRTGLRQAREFRQKERSKFKGWFWRPREMQHPRQWIAAWLSAAVAGSAAGWLLWVILKARAAGPLEPQDWLRILVWAPPGMLLALILTGIYFVGLLGRGLSEKERQWWSRLGGWLGLLGLGWLALYLAAFHAPPVLRWLGGEAPQLVGSVGLGWLLATVTGVLAGRSAATSRAGKRPWLEFTARTAPYVFVVGLVMLLSLGIDTVLPRILGEETRSGARAAQIGGVDEPPPADGWAFGRLRSRHREELNHDAHWLVGRGRSMLMLLAGLAAATAALSWRVDINEFSMHNFYRDRLRRPYLGASRRRRPDAFTGFDPDDDIYLHRLLAKETSEEREEREKLEGGESKEASAPPWNGLFDGPYPILNTTLNLTSGQDPAWQERQANSFVFTPQVHGFEPGPAEKLRGIHKAYRPIARAGQSRRHRPGDPTGVSLGTAMTVSGAAVNPNMGYHSAPALAFLMTVFNARLGLWMGNPAHDETWNRKAPTLGLEALLRELFGMTDADCKWVNLADGGFFDNLGIYELVRRRCRFILACDAEADADLQFNALGNVIRRCRADFGIEIRFENLDPLKRQGDGPFSRWHCAVGTIHYDRKDPGAPKGILIYVKASLTGDEPADLLNYRRKHPEFPHESTGDQWFGESQFESYRRLGQHIGRVIFRAVGLEPGD